MWCFIVLLPPGAPVKACTTILCGQVGQRAMSTSKWMVFGGPFDLAHSEKLSFHQRHLKKTSRWTLNLLMLGGLVAGVTPLAHLQDLPCPQSCCHRDPCFVIRCPKSDHISFGGMNLAVLWAFITDCLLRNE